MPNGDNDFISPRRGRNTLMATVIFMLIVRSSRRPWRLGGSIRAHQRPGERMRRHEAQLYAVLPVYLRLALVALP
jgi:hypothetical protein